jgi:two-component system response regulator HydG
MNQLKQIAGNPLVYIVDDDESTREVLKAFYLSTGYEVEVFSSPLTALSVIGSGQSPKCELVICDLKMPEMDGIAFVEKVRALPAPPPVILLTAHASVQTAVEGLTKGAFDYITKPVNFVEIGVISDRAIKVNHLEQSYRLLKTELSNSWVLEDIVGRSPKMQNVFTFIKKVSHSSCNVLITGESGTGKEIVARAIHAQSPRSKKRFIAINCAAIPDALLESELFGHTKGSFTGATERRRGLFEEANEGTLLLDEIGDMPLALQTKLLRFLQDKTVKSVGENSYRALDVRIISATHQDLEAAVKKGDFREDLYYRLCVATLKIPPLRERQEDILLLAGHFLEKFNKKSGSKILGFTKSAMTELLTLPWAGNVRELENVIERAVVFCEGTLIDRQDIQVSSFTAEPAKTPEIFSKLMPLREVEKEYIEYVLAKTGNKLGQSATILGVDRKTLFRKRQLFDHPLELPDESSPSA